MRGCSRLLTIALLGVLAGRAAAQGATDAIANRVNSATGFFGAEALRILRSGGFRTDSMAPAELRRGSPTIGDRRSPLSIPIGDLGRAYAFTHQADTIIVFSITRPLDISAEVLLPSDLFVMQTFVSVFSARGSAPRWADFPDELQPPLAALHWPNPVKLGANTIAVRATPAGDFVTAMQTYFQVQNLTGVSVVEFIKTKTSSTTGVYQYGTVNQPFGVDALLQDPMLTYQKDKQGMVTIRVASTLTVKGKSYEFAGSGGKAKIPDILSFKTDGLTMQDLSDLSRAISKPMLGRLPTDASLPQLHFTDFSLISLRPPGTAALSADFKTPDASKVVVVAARPKATEPLWNITGPMLRVAGAVHLSLARRGQDVASAYVDAHYDEADPSKSAAYAKLALNGLDIPDTQMQFKPGITGEFAVSTQSAIMRITAKPLSDCFDQELTFYVDSKGVPRLDTNIKSAGNQLNPTTFYKKLEGCKNDAKGAAIWGWQVAANVYRFTANQIINASSPVLGPEATAVAAKAANMPVDAAGKAFGAIMGKDDLLVMARNVWGTDKIADIADAAGYDAESIFHWCARERVGLDEAAKWVHAGANSTKFWKDPILKAADKVYHPSDKELASMSRSIGYDARATLDWLAAYKPDLSRKEILKILGQADYAKDQVKNAAMTAYNWSSSEFEDWFKDGCKAVLGWAKIC